MIVLHKVLCVSQYCDLLHKLGCSELQAILPEQKYLGVNNCEYMTAHRHLHDSNDTYLLCAVTTLIALLPLLAGFTNTVPGAGIKAGVTLFVVMAGW